MSERHIVLYPVEAPVAELELVLSIPVRSGGSARVEAVLPVEFIRCCAWGSVRILAITPSDVPCVCQGKLGEKGKLLVQMIGPGAAVPTIPKTLPSHISVHLVGRARTSPPAWERHSRQQFISNRRAFSKALP